MGVSCDDIRLLARDYWPQPLVIGATMTWMISLASAAFTGWTVEWAQRRCELWAHVRDKDL
jgi:hypothetical protein